MKARKGSDCVDKDVFAKRIIELRKKKGYTQQQLADILQVTNKAVSRWETGEGFPDITLIKPLSDALGVTCDELLNDQKNYTDIKKSDIQKYIPYLVAISSLFVYYILLKLGVPQVLVFALFVAGLGASCYLMVQHTDKTRFLNLLKFQTLLLYFPLANVFMSVYVLYCYIKITDSATNAISTIITSGFASSVDGDMKSIMSVTTDIIWVYVLAAVFSIVCYMLVKNQCKRRFHMEWKTLSLRKMIFEKFSISNAYEPTPLAPKTAQKLNCVTNVICICLPILYVTIMYFAYRHYANDVPLVSYEELNTIVTSFIQRVATIFYIAIGIGSIASSIGFMKTTMKKMYSLKIVWLVVYCGVLVNKTSIEVYRFIRLPQNWLILGAICAIVYGIYVLRKKQISSCFKKHKNNKVK